MPHIVVEYSNNLTDSIQKSEILGKLHESIIESGLFSPDAVKSRSISYDDYILDEASNNFIHITISILSGRTTEQRLKLSESAYNTAIESVPSAQKISVNINEMNKETYKK